MPGELTSERLVIRELTKDDAEALFAYRSHPDVARYQSWKPESLEDAQAFIATLLLHPPYAGGAWHQLAVTLKSDGTMIGDCGVRVTKHDSRLCEIGLTIAPEHHRQGYGIEAVRTVLAFLFGPLKMKRVSARTLARNAGARAMLARLGFKAEKGGRYGLDAEEWDPTAAA